MTKNEKQHLSRVAGLGCIACRKLGFYDSEAEIHHLREGQGVGMRASNYDAIPLCHKHHRTGGYGVAFHAGKQAFEDQFGTESELLAEIYELLGYEHPEKNLH
jgi:hypothetical protein